nr:I78 family peptidase inhibitor [Frigidibacter sp. ROC022]
MVILTALACGVAGCARVAEKFEPPARFELPELPSDSCNSAGFRGFVGQSSAALGTVFIPEPYRVLEEGAPVTQDYNPIRLNFDLATDGTVVRVWCG